MRHNFAFEGNIFNHKNDKTSFFAVCLQQNERHRYFNDQSPLTSTYLDRHQSRAVRTGALIFNAERRIPT